MEPVLLQPAGLRRGVVVDWPERFPIDNPPDWVLPTTHPWSVLGAEDERDAAYDGLVADLVVAAEALAGSA